MSKRKDVKSKGTRKRSQKKAEKSVNVDNTAIVKGRYQLTLKGIGFVILEDKNLKDIRISQDFTLGAMNGDIVMAKYNPNASHSDGKIIEIVERSIKKVVGKFEKHEGFGFVLPDNRKLQDIFISKKCWLNAQTGDKVVAEIDIYPEKSRKAEGRIIEVIGNINTKGIEILSIIKAHDLQEDFPERVLAEAEKIPGEVLEKELDGRVDLRNIKMVTIDGEDAKDLDDAVSLSKNEKGNYVLIVAIADVSYYVKENSALDKEALSRGTSTYLVDRVIPMLPRKLSNGICSLNAKVDRLSLTCEMEIDAKGSVINYKIYKSIINVDERMTYTDVTKILDDDQEMCERYNNLISDFHLMKELALILRSKRFSRGSIDLNIPESKIILDDNGSPIDVKKYQVTISNNIIEEFMLIANETVAQAMFFQSAPFIYRVHGDPNDEKLDYLKTLLANLGIYKKKIDSHNTKDFQDILKLVKNTPNDKIISTLLLRSLQKAKYSDSNDGHFALAAEYYCHFTSPIRRYPDLFIHRVISYYIKSNYTLDKKTIDNLRSKAETAALHSSDTERKAELAERESCDLKKAEYMRKHIGETFEGVISSMASFGFFVELPNTIEGLVRVKDLEDDYYEYDESMYRLIGKKTKKIYQIGDPVSIIVVAASTETMTIDFVLSKR